ncbi:MAG: class II aldolase/adducin family protein [Betaproteobacteria bacterium]|nr:class II aldolase/adducin family protein [Betaproteobacteria bacterium]
MNATRKTAKAARKAAPKKATSTARAAVRKASSVKIPRGISPAEWKVRCDLAACYQLVDLYDMADLTGTHISARVPGPEHHFLLNPYGWLFDEITASSLIKVDLNGNVVWGPRDKLNFAGFVLHSAIHMAVPELICVLHSHTVANAAVGMHKSGLRPLSQKAMILQHFLRYHDYEGTADNLDERARVVANMGTEGRVMILRNHGALTVGRTVGEAFSWMYTLEMACKQQVAGLTGTEDDITQLSPDLIAHVREQGRAGLSPGGHSERGFEWPALLRKLERDRGTAYRT